MVRRIDTAEARAKLTARNSPYWVRLVQGCSLGYRKLSVGTAGTWLARVYDPVTRKDTWRALGAFDELPLGRRHDAAKRAAEELATHLGKGGFAGSGTVGDACDRYVRHLRETKGEKAAQDAGKRFKSYVLDNPRLAGTELTKLTPATVNDWRRALAERPTKSGGNRGAMRTPSTLNRDMSCFRAALNLAMADGLATSDFAWRGKLRPLKDADRNRELYLDRAQRRRFIESAPPDLAAFLRALCLLPLRPGALAALTAGNFDTRLGVLTIGKDKSGRDRKLMLPKETAEFFNKTATDKLPSAPLLVRADGRRWDKDAWKRPVKVAAEAAELPPGVTAYTLRHSTITDLVHDGLDLLTVAQVAGTSVRMIEKHYGHLRSERAVTALAALAV